VNILRRLPLSRLLLSCGLVLVLAGSATALAFALDSGPRPLPKPLASAVHDALAGPPVEGFSANVKLANRLVEGANLASGGNGEASQLSSSPLLSGATGRVWIAKDGRVRLELQAEKGDTQLYYDGHTASLFDASTNTVYRYVVPSQAGSHSETPDAHHEVPSVAKIEEAITKLKRHANLSGATPSDVAGQPTYTVRISPNEGGSLIGGAELSWDANNGVPLRAAVYSSNSASPVLELAVTGEVSFSPVEASVFEFKPPRGAKIQDVKLAESNSSQSPTHSPENSSHPTVTKHGHGIGGVVVVEDKKASSSQKESSALPEGLPKVKVNGATATELRTALGTLLTFERSGVRYVVGGFVAPGTVEEVARGL
jgi:outer membrane lipoprotein-sorting protein